MQNVSETLLSQFAAGPTITAIIDALNSAVDPSADLQNVYSQLWDISSAVGQGPDNWGQIVGVSRNLQVAYVPEYFGFNEGNSAANPESPFNGSPMYAGPLSSQTYALGDSDYRTLILVKAAANIGSLTASSINALLTSLYSSSGRSYVQDTGGMSQRYVFEFTPSAVQLAIITTSGVIPRSAGVQAEVILYPAGTTFGFNEAPGAVPFGSGTLFPTTGLQNAI